jgi:uncharacterized protein (DUF2062 family)
VFQRRVALHPIQKLREALWPSIGWKRATLYVWRRIWRLSGTPHTIAVGVAAGAFMSITPFLGFHIVGAVLIAWVFRGNLVAAAFGTLVGNPLTYPAIWWGTYDIGNLMLGSHARNDIDLAATLMSSKAFDVILPVLAPMALASVPLGLITAFICYFIIKSTVTAYQQRRRESLELRVMLRRKASKKISSVEDSEGETEGK